METLTKIAIAGMSCQSCVRKVSQILHDLKGVLSFDVYVGQAIMKHNAALISANELKTVIENSDARYQCAIIDESSFDWVEKDAFLNSDSSASTKSTISRKSKTSKSSKHSNPSKRNLVKKGNLVISIPQPSMNVSQSIEIQTQNNNLTKCFLQVRGE